MAKHAAPTLRHRTKTVKQHTNRSAPRYGRSELEALRTRRRKDDDDKRSDFDDRRERGDRGGRPDRRERPAGQGSARTSGGRGGTQDRRQRPEGRFDTAKTARSASPRDTRSASGPSPRFDRAERPRSDSRHKQSGDSSRFERSGKPTGARSANELRNPQEQHRSGTSRSRAESTPMRSRRRTGRPADFSDEVRQRRRQQQAAFHSIDTHGDSTPARGTRSSGERTENSSWRERSKTHQGTASSSERRPRRTSSHEGSAQRVHQTHETPNPAFSEREESSVTTSKVLPKKRTRTGELVEQKEGLRLNKFLADAGIASRRGSDELIEAGLVKVNGSVVHEKGTRVQASDLVTVKGEPVSYLKHLSYLVLNKPKDYITTTNDEKGRKTVMDLVPLKQRLYPVGRLDRNTTGTLLITNDGELATRLMHPSHEIEREYVVGLDKRLSPEHAKKIVAGVELEDGTTGPAEIFVNPEDKTELRIVLKEGRNREVRRIFEHFHYDVKRLHRVRYAMISVAGLSRGEYRHLTRDEIRELRRMVGLDD